MTVYDEMLRIIKSQNITCYNTLFIEMIGNSIFVDYDLSSLKHYKDDLSKEKLKSHGIIIKKVGFILNEKGMVSVYGVKWEPKKENDRRFIAKPGTNNITQSPSKKGTKEIHFTDNNTLNAHSDPHTHIIIWNPDTGIPKLGSPINEILEFKSYKGVIYMNKNIPYEKHFEKMRFKTISDCKWVIQYCAKIEI